jgi:hypothetical protein
MMDADGGRWRHWRDYLDGGIGAMSMICTHTASIRLTELPDMIAGREDW